MKYRIIHKYDLNGDGHYEAQYQEKLWFGLTWWRTLQKYTPHFCFPARFDTPELAESAVIRHCNSRTRFCEQVSEGET